MKEERTFFVVEKSVLPEVFLKVVEVKKLLESGKEKTVQDAAAKVGVSRSAFYKYKDFIFPFYENFQGKTITMAFRLTDTPGLLSHVLNRIADAGANILTINQNIPLNGIAHVTATIETGRMKKELKHLLDNLNELEGIRYLKIISREDM